MEINWDEELAPNNRQRTQRILLAVAIVPWAIIIAVFFTQRTTTTETLVPQPTPTHQETTEPRADQGFETAPEPAPAPTPLVQAPILSSSPADEHSQRMQIESFALVMASQHMRDPSHNPAGHVIEQIAVEGIDTTSPTVTVVTVIANYRTATESGLYRMAIPVVPKPSGGFTLLPIYPLLAGPFVYETPDIDHLISLDTQEPARKALHAAGFTDITDLEVFGAAGWPTMALVTMSLPDGDEQFVVLLHDTADGYVVAGDDFTKPAITEALSEVLR